MANIEAAERIPSTDLADRVRALIEREGLAGAQRVLGLSRPTVLSLVARTGSQPGTIAMAEQRLAIKVGT